LRVLPIASPAATSRIWFAHRRRGGGALLKALADLAVARRERP
jgi:hypothetical protein